MDFLGFFIPEAMRNVQGAKVMMVVFDIKLDHLGKQMEYARNHPLSSTEKAGLTEKIISAIAKLHKVAESIAQKIDTNIEPLLRAGLQPHIESNRRMTDIPRAVAEITNVSHLLRRMIDEEFEKHMHVFRRVYDLPVVRADQDIRDRCTICFENFTEGEFLAKLPCRHLFHRNCIVPLLMANPFCPADRISIMQ